MNKQVEEYKKVLDIMGIGYREISVGSSSKEKAHIKTGLILTLGCGIPSKLEIEHYIGGGKQLAINGVRKMILELNEKVHTLSDKLAEIQNNNINKKKQN